MMRFVEITDDSDLSGLQVAGEVMFTGAEDINIIDVGENS